ncbi:flavodoxin family protein [Mycoplasmatota bacterium zrk1]
MILILNGSPNKNGHTMKTVKKIIKGIDEEHIIINSYAENIKACIDCKYCDNLDGCSINDNMIQIYDLIDSADKIIIASPLYFASLSSSTLDIISRFQTFFTKKFIRKEDVKKLDKSLLVCTAGGDWPTMFNGPIETMKIVNMLFSIGDSMNLLIKNTDKINSQEIDVTKYIKFLK